MADEASFDNNDLSAGILSLPPEVFGRVTYSLTPLQRQHVINSLDNPGKIFSNAEIFSAWIWSNIFELDSWPDQICRRIPEGDLALIGPDIETLVNQPNADAFLLLLVLDWSGEARYLKPSLFESFKNPELYNENKKQVRLAGTCIKIQFNLDPDNDDGDASVEVRDPRVFFRQSREKLWTNVLYYSDDTIYTISNECIRGIGGINRVRKGHIRERCSVDVVHRGGTVRPQLLFASDRPTSVVANFSHPGRRGQIVGWRLPTENAPPNHISTFHGM
jgi:hypothetical protein